MAADSITGASGVALGASIKSGLAAGMFATLVALLAVVLGFTVVPLAPGREQQDAIKRLAAGLLCSFTLGPIVAFKAIETFPWLMAPWSKILEGQEMLWVYLASAAPFIAVSAVLGFWIVAAAMRWFTSRESKDVGELLTDAKSMLD